MTCLWQVEELEEANAALEDMNTQMEAASLRAQQQRDELQSRLEAQEKSEKDAESLQNVIQSLNVELQVQILIRLVTLSCILHQARKGWAAPWSMSL